MDLRAALARNVFLPFYERRWGIHVDDERRALEISQFESTEALLRLQWARLCAVLDHAATASPFYRERLAGLRAGDLRSPADLRQLPVLSKDDLRNEGERLICEGVRREELIPKRTGGSTGVPVRLFWDRSAHRNKRALVKRHDAWAGYRLGDKLAALWGDTEKSYPLKERLFQELCMRTLFLDTLRLDDVHMAAFVETLRRERPRILMGHAHSIFFFSDYLRAEGIDDIRFDGIISTAESLLPAERERIEAQFGNVVFDRYGCEELSLVASECEAHDGLHVAAEGLFVEILDDEGAEPGRLVITDLFNRAMPLIRYEVGDLARWQPGKCACGRGLPRLERVFGRTTEFLFAPDGRRISGVSILDTFMIHVPGIRQAQIVQDQLDHILLRVVPAPEYGPASAEQLGRTVVGVFGAAMRHDLELVDAIEPTARGKYQFTVCRIEPPRA